jgi:hypothetical protein
MPNEATHLVLGDTAAGVLREAMAGGAVPAAPVLRFRDIYCVGPLGALGSADGPASRARYWAQLLPEARPAVAEFDEEEVRYAQACAAAGTGLVVWLGAHSSAQLWWRRLASMLPAGAAVHVVEVAEPGTDPRRRRTPSQFAPRAFGRLLARARYVDGAELAQLAEAWRREAAVDSGVRRWIDGGISHHGDDCYDGLLLAQCDADWQPAEQAIGSAQWECDEFIGDVFFTWRLRCLAQAGQVLWRGPLARPAQAEVRLAAAGDDGVH